jgi:hypothetical protein
MTMVKINGEALEVTVDAEGQPLADVARAALDIHRRVCRGTRAAERADEKRSGVVKTVSQTEFGFPTAPVADTEDEE